MKTYSLAETKDILLGNEGKKERDQYEFELNLDLIGRMIKAARLERNLTQIELGDKIGVKKSQISKLENTARNVTIETILKVFKALDTKVSFRVELKKLGVRN